jgi:hypothetical protein
MKKLLFLPLLAFLLVSFSFESYGQTGLDGPITLHPKNPHYFLYRDTALALITSAEHYGALVNLDFDYRTYLESLSADGMNYTRIFTGSYFEIPGESFGIEKNTLAPEIGRVITPWKEVELKESGRPLYDLSTWNPDYFKRLKDFMSYADQQGIIVEVTLFSSIYRQEHWEISPQNPVNNMNIDHEVSLKEAHTLNNGKLFGYQEKFVRKMVQELNEFDNFFFEIQNEPWSDHPVASYNIVNKEELKANDWTFKADLADRQSLDWQKKIAEIISEEESGMPKKHLIAQNYTNFKAPVPSVGENISIINFHYAWPEAVEWNYHYNRVIGFDESGFAGSDDQVYRRQAWKFMLSGGGLYNNLDYSFYPGSEDGTGENNAPGGGSPALRKQLRILSNFLHGFELVNLRPDFESVLSSPGLIPYVLSDGENQFAIYLRAVGTETARLEIKAGNGEYSVTVLNTITGETTEIDEVRREKDKLIMEFPIPEGEMAVKVVGSF